MRTLLCAVLLTLSSLSFAQNGGVIFLVRHAERSLQGGDAALLNDSNLRHGDQAHTADSRSLSRRPSLAAEDWPRDDIDGPVKNLKAVGNAKVLVVAHADTLPKILAQLGAGSLPESKPNEQNYDYLVIVPMQDGKAESLSVIRYRSATE